jgi:hypothetical protein
MYYRYQQNETVSIEELAFEPIGRLLHCQFDFNLRCTEFSIDAEDLEQKVRESLSLNGIAIIKDFLSKSAASNLLTSIIELVQSVESNVKLDHYPNVVVQSSGNLVYDSYDSIVDSGKTVFNYRPYPDSGFLDIFNPELSSKNVFDFVEFLRSSNIASCVPLSENDRLLSIRNFNVYINRGQLSTRYFHADSYIDRYKLFIYLTDTMSLWDGGHQYVVGTQCDLKLRSFNIAVNSHLRHKADLTDFCYFDRSKIVSVLGPAGTAFLSNQAGAHRGHPQTNSGTRVVFVVNFK